MRAHLKLLTVAGFCWGAGTVLPQGQVGPCAGWFHKVTGEQACGKEGSGERGSRGRWARA